MTGLYLLVAGICPGHEMSLALSWNQAQADGCAYRHPSALIFVTALSPQQDVSQQGCHLVPSDSVENHQHQRW